MLWQFFMPNMIGQVIDLGCITGRKWRKENLEFIKNNYQKMSDEELAEKLDRTVEAIKTKRKRIGCTLTNKKYDWNTVLDLFSKTDYELLSEKEDYKDAATRSIKYICPHHRNKGIQKIAIGHMINGEGCRYCGIDRRAEKKTFNFDLLENEFIETCKNLDFEYLGYDRIDKKVKIHFICNKHRDLGDQYQTLGNFRINIGCKYCARKDLPVWYIENELNEKAPNMEVLEPFNKLTDKVKCRCKIHDTYNVKQVNKIIAGEGCHKCRMTKITGSWCEETIRKILINWGYEHKCQYTFEKCRDKRKLPFDFYLPHFNVCIEFDGPQHFYPIHGEKSFKTVKYHDNIKDKYCEDNNIILIRIPYWKYEIIEYYLFDEFVKYNLIKVL